MKIEIFEEDGDNTLSFDNKYADFTIDVYPDSKTYKSRMSLKDDVYYRTEKFEYRIKTDPLKVETRLTERVDEPPQEYAVKDGVVLESEIIKERTHNGRLMDSDNEFIKNLKKEVEWHEDWVGNPVSIYILSKHPDIVTQENYRRHLRQLSEKIKNATLKVEKALELDEMGLKVTDEWEGSGRSIWYSKSKQDEMSEEETKKVIEHVHKIQEKLFDEQSKEYVGISDGEFRSSKEILENIETFINKKPTSAKKEAEPKISKTKGLLISLFLTLFLSWVVSWFVDINPFLIFVLVQVIAFLQSLLGGWISRFFERA